ncbi:uncharacterized protein LOC110066788 isoform X2 [Orbicella faveolata]|uniref:uncharacterized protein LOC110066788 isoform X2 n=1 Tax=Orbicella faveolata TaxID=48498 RepID=UPI0009E403FB|nr:uncharacterized protein LOC110066788 isoform X2 [Orbicella faveolata]
MDLSQPPTFSMPLKLLIFHGEAKSYWFTGGEPAAVNNKKSIQCKYVNNGNQCQERISKRSKSGYCNAHRTVIRISKQVASSPKQLHTNSKPVPDPQRDDSAMVDQQQLERLHQLSEASSCTTSHMPQATEELPQEMFNVEDDDRDRCVYHSRLVLD